MEQLPAQFARQTVRLQFPKDVHWGDDITVWIAKAGGDLARSMYLRVTWPSDAPTTVQPSAGTAMIDRIELLYRDQLIERIYGENLYMLGDISIPQAKQSALSNLVGTGTTTALSSYHIPLPFLILKKGLPLLALKEAPRFRVVFQPSTFFTATVYTKTIDVSLFVEYVYVSKAERDWFTSHELAYLTHTFQRVQFKVPNSFSSQNSTPLFRLDGTSGNITPLPIFNNTTHISDYYQFTTSNSTYINCGSKTINLGTIGFSAVCWVKWDSFNAWQRIFDFNNGTGIDDIFLTIPGTNSSPLRFVYRANGIEQVTDYNATISLNTLYKIAVVYNPTIGSTGQVQIWINGSVVVTNTSMSDIGTDRTLNNTYFGRSSYPPDAYFDGKIYKLDIYNNPLTDTEAIAYTTTGSLQTVLNPNYTFVVQTEFVNDVKELFWVIQSEAASNVYDYGNELVNLQLTLNNQDYITRDYATAQYLHVLQPLQYHTRVPTGNYYMYSFAVQPENDQPTGELNMTEITRQQHSLTLAASASVRNLRMYAHSYNVFRIKDGHGTTVFPLREGGTKVM